MPAKMKSRKAKAKVRPMQSNSVIAVNTKSANKPASIKTDAKGTVVTHREVVSESVIVDSAFGVTHTIAIQPAISSYSRGSPLGPWISKIAAEYDHYQFVKLKLHYVPTCATTQAGLVVLSCDPNPDGQQPENFSSMKNMSSAVTGPARERLTLDISSMVRKRLLTRTGAVSSYPLYDAGRLFVAGLAGTGVSTGYLEVEYTVSLSHPQTGPRLEDAGGLAVVYTSTTYRGNPVIGTPGAQRFVGTANVQRSAGNWMKDAIATAVIKQGSSALAPITIVPRTAVLNWTSPSTGVRYSANTALDMPYWTMSKMGMYRFKARLAADWQNFATFGCQIVTWGVNSVGAPNPASGFPSDALCPIKGDSANVLYVPATYAGWRGFRTTETGGTDDCDLVVDVDIVFSSEVGERFSFLIGVRDDSNIGENANAWIIYDSRAGQSLHTLEYLGTID